LVLVKHKNNFFFLPVGALLFLGPQVMHIGVRQREPKFILLLGLYLSVQVQE
jgi:hypothetical protein